MLTFVLWMIGVFMIVSIPSKSNTSMVFIGALLWPIIGLALMIAFLLANLFGNNQPPGPTANA